MLRHSPPHRGPSPSASQRLSETCLLPCSNVSPAWGSTTQLGRVGREEGVQVSVVRLRWAILRDILSVVRHVGQVCTLVDMDKAVMEEDGVVPLTGFVGDETTSKNPPSGQRALSLWPPSADVLCITSNLVWSILACCVAIPPVFQVQRHVKPNMVDSGLLHGQHHLYFKSHFAPCVVSRSPLFQRQGPSRRRQQLSALRHVRLGVPRGVLPHLPPVGLLSGLQGGVNLDVQESTVS